MAVKDTKKNAPSSSVKLREELQEKNKEFHFKDDIFAMTLLTNPGYISSSRNIMFTSHLRQFVNLTNPDFPKVFSNYENTVGKNSTGYFKTKSNYEVIAKIPRYENGVNDEHSYLLFIYDKENDKYEVIEKKNIEDLTEKFGFAYNNDVMDSKNVGDKIAKDEVLYKTTSYDESLNYRYGKNAKFVYLLENNTIEDAIVISESFAQSMVSKEVETVKVSLNDNDILCNIYGNNEKYQSFPNIGELIKDKVVCAKRRIHNSQLLYDVKKSNLRKINYSSDVLYFNDGVVTDIIIYSNKTKDELEDNNFNKQMLYYLKMQETFYTKIVDVCQGIFDSGSSYSSDIGFFYKKAKNIMDDNFKWREEDNSVFSNMVIEFVIERDIGLSVGQKISGRYGNKGVISKILPDDEMPFLENGEKIDIIFNTLGVINRLNSQQLFENSITFICNRVREKIATLDTMAEKEKLLNRILWYFNENQEKKMKKYLSQLSKAQKESFFQNIVEDGIYVHVPPLWEKEPLFDRLRKLYDEFKWIEPYDVFVNRFGRKIKVLKKLIIGDMYVIKLKQTSKKGFSVRATGGLSKRGIPEKTNKAKNHQELYSKTPIRIGDQENINSAIGVPTEIIAQLHLFYRSSVTGRRHLGQDLMTSLKELESFDYPENFSNRNVEILQAYFKAMGVRLEFSEDKMQVKVYTERLKSYDYNNKLFIGTDAEYDKFKLESDIRKKYDDEIVFVGSKAEFEERIKNEVEAHLKDIKKLVIDVEI